MLFGQSSERAERRVGPKPVNGRATGESPAEPVGKEPKTPQGQRRGSRGHGRRDYARLETEEIVLDVPADPALLRHLRDRVRAGGSRNQ